MACEPTVLAMDDRFIGVYTPAYSAMLAAPRAATSGFTVAARKTVPATPTPTPSDTA